ncbi:MAG: Transcription elongation factor spt6 [Bathelium mastoideum]|nr:MAG: Transcription elongation factor spt6 [Bathelium mastoideum]
MTSNLLDVAAELGSEEEDEDFDDEAGETRGKPNGTNGAIDDSSEEEDDDDDEEAAREVREGFIVEGDDDDEDEDAARERRRERRKRRRAEREADEENLDEEDLDLIGAGTRPAEPKFKRLKRGHRDNEASAEPRGVDDIFSDDEVDALDGPERRPAGRSRVADDYEFADFIEDDEFPDEEADRLRDDLEVARPAAKGFAGVNGLSSQGLDEAAVEDMRAAFGDGTEYDWALELQDQMDEEQQDPDKPLELKDVFEPSQLAEKMLTDEDNEIRNTDVPERFQIARQPFTKQELSEEEVAARMKEEALWISNMMLPKKRFERDMIEPFQKSVGKILEFMNVEDYEVPFIFQHRKDYLIHAVKVATEPDPSNPNAPEYEMRAEKLLNQGDLWEIFELDLKFRALVEKREALARAYENLKSVHGIQDDVFEDMLPNAVTMEELQDVQDYLHFQYAAELKEVNVAEAEQNGTQKRAVAAKTLYEKIRSSKVYNLVRAFGITAEDFAQNALQTGRRRYTEDAGERPDDMADSLLEPPEYSTGAQVLRAARAMFAEELTLSPRVRKLMRQTYYTQGLFDCFRTEKGLRKIDEDHPYYEFKYLRGQDFTAMARRPELYLKMLKAEEEGLIEVKIRLDRFNNFRERLYKEIESDSFSEVADAWNVLRREVLDMALAKLDKIMIKGVKENLKTECENQLAKTCREEYSRKLDQAPYKPRGEILGTAPRVLALSNGHGHAGRDAICWASVEDDGKVKDNGKFVDLRVGNSEKYLPDGRDVASFVELIQRRKPDVIAISGFTVETRKLYKDLQDIIDKHDLRCPEFEGEDGKDKSEKLDVIIVNDEVARLYHTSDRAVADYPKLAPLSRYCVAIAKYVQDPMKEYAALGRDIISIIFDPNQHLVPQDKLLKHLETAMVDYVNLVGVEINDAVADTYTANLLPYVCGLGPRKAQQLLKVINLNGGYVTTREELLGNSSENENMLMAVTAKVWTNCASFLYITYDSTEEHADYLDNTRVHPEDYDLGRKMAADALELDEEDIKAEVDEYGPAAIVRKLVKDDEQEKVNDLILEQYAEQLESSFNQRKRATLETIRAELQQPYEELRRNFVLLSSDEVFTMLTGETKDSLSENMIVPVNVRRIFMDHMEVKLDCGVEGGVSSSEYPEGVGEEYGGKDPRQVYQTGQTVQAKLLFLNRKQLTAQLSLRDDALRRPFRREFDHIPGEWDEAQEGQDKKDAQKAIDDRGGRQQRVVKHPLFRPFNAAQAEEFLGSGVRGDVVIRPSSRGLDHLAITWKVADNVYQHIDVLELDKENEFSVGRTLKIGGKYSYSDLDDLIANHIRAMAKKVDEMMGDERYQDGSKSQTDQWLETYTEANPKRSMYAFCLNPKFPGYFHLCFKAGRDAELCNWGVKIIPNAFELRKNVYPDMRGLKNGFKLLIQGDAQRGGLPRGR